MTVPTMTAAPAFSDSDDQEADSDRIPAPEPHTDPDQSEDAPSMSTRTKKKPAPGSSRSRTGGWSQARRAAYEAKRAAAPSRPAAQKKPAGPDYAGAVAGLFQIGAFVTGMAAQKKQSVALAADAATLVVYGSKVGEGAAKVAESDPRIAALLERIATVGPYAALLTPLVSMAAQMVSNHGMLPDEARAAMQVESAKDIIKRAQAMQAKAA